MSVRVPRFVATRLLMKRSSASVAALSSVPVRRARCTELYCSYPIRGRHYDVDQATGNITVLGRPAACCICRLPIEFLPLQRAPLQHRRIWTEQPVVMGPIRGEAGRDDCVWHICHINCTPLPRWDDEDSEDTPGSDSD